MEAQSQNTLNAPPKRVPPTRGLRLRVRVKPVLAALPDAYAEGNILSGKFLGLIHASSCLSKSNPKYLENYLAR